MLTLATSCMCRLQEGIDKAEGDFCLVRASDLRGLIEEYLQAVSVVNAISVYGAGEAWSLKAARKRRFER